MKAWKKGALLGFIWSLLGFVVEIPIKEIAWLEIIFFFPILVGKLLGFVNVAAFLGGPLMGIIIGAFIGFLYDLRKEKQRTGKIELNWRELSYWQKGAILGVIWSILGFGVNFIVFERYYSYLIGLHELIWAPIFIISWIISFPAFVGLLGIYILGPLTGFILGTLFGYIYGKIRGRGK